MKFEGLSGISRLTAWDIWTNILLFIPYGVLFVLLPAVSTKPAWLKLLLASVSAALLSFAVESGQLLLPRSPSLVDVVFNTVGGVTGGLWGIFPLGAISGLTRQWWKALQSQTGMAVMLTGYLLSLAAVFSLPLSLSPDFGNWDPDFRFQLGNEGSLDRPWRGEIFLVALYDRALSAQEVRTNFAAGPSIRSAQGRVQEGLFVLYDFSESKGDVVHDHAITGPPVDLRIRDLAQVQWLTPNGLGLREATVIMTSEPPAKLSARRLTARSELSVEAWVSPADLSLGRPARIVSYSKDLNQRNFTLGQQDREIFFRLRTPISGLNGTNPELRTSGQPLELAIQHLIVTYANGIETLYLNGAEQGMVFLRAKLALIDVLVGEHLGNNFKWPLVSVFIFPLGILSCLFHARRRPSQQVVCVSLVTALAGVAFIEGLRLLTLQTTVEPFFIPVAVGTAVISILLASSFPNSVRHR